MRLIDLLNELEHQGKLSLLYQAGALNIKCFNHREIFNYYSALLVSAAYTDRRHKAVQATAEGCKVARSTVYAAIREMTKSIEANAAY